MELLNQWIVEIYESGHRVDAYNIINSIGNYAAYLFGIVHGLKLKVKWWVVLLAVLLERFVSGYVIYAILYVEYGFSDPVRADAVVWFAFVPLFGFLLARILRRPYREIWDIIMPIPLVMFIGARVACTFAGCCRGFPCSWGVYNVKVDEILFPVQLLQGLATALILGAMLVREKKNGFVPDGRNVPIILISYGITRFFLEFLQDNEKILLGCSRTSFHCLLMILSGLLCLWIIKRSETKEKEAPNAPLYIK